MNLHAARAIAHAATISLMFCDYCKLGELHIHVDVLGGESWIGMLW